MRFSTHGPEIETFDLKPLYNNQYSEPQHKISSLKNVWFWISVHTSFLKKNKKKVQLKKSTTLQQLQTIYPRIVPRFGSRTCQVFRQLYHGSFGHSIDRARSRTAKSCCTGDVHLGCFQKIGGKPPKWMVFVMENPIKMDVLGIPPIWEYYINNLLWSEIGIIWDNIYPKTYVFRCITRIKCVCLDICGYFQTNVHKTMSVI